MPSDTQDKDIDIEKLSSQLKRYKNVYIVPHVNPDPDALASALLWQYILRKAFNIHAHILLAGIIGREENKTLIKECSIKLKEMKSVVLKKNGQGILLLDTQHSHGNSPLPKGIMPTAVIDHHPLRKTSLRIPYNDIRPDYGATVTISYEYVKALSLNLPKKIATAMLYGLKTDTLNLTRLTTKDDVEVYYDLLEKSDGRKLARIEMPPLPLDYYKAINKSFQRALLYENIIVVNLHELPSTDYPALIADFFISYQNAEWVLVSGIYQNKLILSLRNKHTRKDAGEMIRSLIGGRGSGGGHQSSSGGFIELNDDSDEIITRLEKDIVSRLLNNLLGKVVVGEFLLQKGE